MTSEMNCRSGGHTLRRSVMRREPTFHEAAFPGVEAGAPDNKDVRFESVAALVRSSSCVQSGQFVNSIDPFVKVLSVPVRMTSE